jgi:hypothetical protein
VSKVIYVCLNERRRHCFSKRNLELLSGRLTPDNITALPPKIVDDEGIVYCVFSPSSSVLAKNSSVCLGNVIGREAKWWEPLQGYPDGSYALFRGNGKYVEVVTDVVASRTIWYFKNDDVFISSTSQRAIIFFLRSFVFNEAVIPWVLSTGALGPAHSWDSRIKSLPADSSIVLDRSSWHLNTAIGSCSFSTLDRSDEEHGSLLRQALTDTFEPIKLDYSKWTLPLSGGYDSRGILCMLKETGKDIKGLKTVTWGVRSALDEKDNDAYVAKSLADHFNVQHKYYETDVSDEPLEDIFSRFLVCGEGRIDHIPGYMDGFKIWKTLFESGTHGIIRGDEGFGWSSVLSPLEVRRKIGIPLWSDFSNLRSLEKFGFSKQELPTNLLRREGESLEAWRDRLYQQWRLPVVMAALNDLKLPYVEIMNPLLSRRIIYQVRRVPDHLRTYKRLYKMIVRSLSPKVDFAKYPAIHSSQDILRSRRVVELLEAELSSAYAGSILPVEFSDYVLDRLEVIDETNRKIRNFRARRTIRAAVKQYLPTWTRKEVHNSAVQQEIDFNVVAFRAYTISRMNKMLAEDAESLA